MTKIIILLFAFAVVGGFVLIKSQQARNIKEKVEMNDTAEKRGIEKIVKSDEEWKKELSPEEYYVLRKRGTERAFTGEFWDHHEEGVYLCAACGQELFSSRHKFESGSGWPSFWQPLDKENIGTEDDDSFFMHRVEVICSRCGSHLGHVFDDGPQPTGLRYCINSVSLDFAKKPQE